MKLELLIFGITAFFIYDSYKDGYFSKTLLSYKKYYKMIFFAIIGVGIYLLIKRNPIQGRKMLLSANNLVKFMPIDKSSLDLLTPIIDYTSTNHTSNPNNLQSSQSAQYPMNPMNPMNFGNKKPNGNKRSVSETKKKYVASQQDWKCGHCKSQLNHTFEIDHRVRLEYGGSNDVSNLVALCRNCHGIKTANENM